MSGKEKLIDLLKLVGIYSEEPHFHKTSYRANKKIFATYDEHSDLLVVKLNTIDQDVFCLANKGKINPVPNKWGTQGWTQFTLSNVREEVLIDILTTAYLEVSKK